MNELARIDQWIVETLAADTALTAVLAIWDGAPAIFADVAPPTAEYPFVVFKLLAPDDVMGAGQNRIMVDALYLVHATAISDSWQGDLKTIADRISTVLHLADGTAADATILASTRQRPYRQLEHADGIEYRHLGAEFQILAQI